MKVYAKATCIFVIFCDNNILIYNLFILRLVLNYISQNSLKYNCHLSPLAYPKNIES